MIDIIKKKYKTRSGLDVRLISDQGHPDWPIVGYVGDNGQPCSWKQDGTFFPKQAHDYDLIEIKEKKVIYVNVFHGGISHYWYPSKDIADRAAIGCERFARIRVEYEEGQFDD